MPRGGAHFSSEELARVLSHYDIGVIHQVKALSAGSRRVPKVVVTSEKGKFVLKRRPRGKDDLDWVTFAHSVQNHLANKKFPVAPLLSTRDENNTILNLDNHIYEFFKFIKGTRYDGSREATTQAGRQLARFHLCLADFRLHREPQRVGFHDSSAVRRHIKTIGAGKKTSPKKQSQTTAEALLNLYNDSSIRVNKLGFVSWRQQVVHGDWHPGNMLFSDHKFAAVLDFDAVKVAPPVTDLANGMLQFSIVASPKPAGQTGGKSEPADWPDYFDEDRFLQFLNGYYELVKLDKKKLNSLIDLMVETMIAEAVLPVAATGFFGDFTGLDFLKMIRRKADWLSKNRIKLTQAICS
jgi:Ser/Thr protein kinase RdoA (MazF antagonist)